MALLKEPHAEPIPGYRLLERLGQGGFGEVWKCEAPGGLCKAIKFVHGDVNCLHFNADQVEEELKAIQRIKTIRHPFLLSIERVEHIDGELLLITELADKSLHDVWLEYRKANAVGIPRGQLLTYLQEAAEILDVLNFFYDLQHLDLKPQNLFLVSNHLKVGDFGLVSSLVATPASAPKRGLSVSPIYGSPEMYTGRISRHSDQYSLAIVYQQMLTGTLPFEGKNLNQYVLLHSTAKPNLEALPAADQPVIGRALAKVPEQRFPSCKEFIQTLLKNGAVSASLTETQRFSRTTVINRNKLNSVAQTMLEKSALGKELASERQELTAQDKGKGNDRERKLAAGRFAFLEKKSGQPSLLSRWQLLESLESNPLFDLWDAQDAHSRLYQVRIIYGLNNLGGKQRRKAVQRLCSLRHDLLPGGEIFDEDLGRLILCTPKAPRTLMDRFEQCRSQKMTGIPREELLEYLRHLASGLDQLGRAHGLYHLRLHPRNVWLGPQQPLVDEFGLAQLFWLPAGKPPSNLMGRYSAPELAQGKANPFSDQYSLALIYCALLTGRYPSPRTPTPAYPDDPGFELGNVPKNDRPIIARALSRDPARRWPSCSELMQELQGASGQTSCVLSTSHDEFVKLVAEASHLPRPDTIIVSSEAYSILKLLLRSATQHEEERNPEKEVSQPVLSERRSLLSHQFCSGLSLGDARLKVNVIRQLWQGVLCLDAESRYVFHLRLPTKYWRLERGSQSGLRVLIQLSRQLPLEDSPVQVRVRIKPYRCKKKRGLRLLQNIGLSLLEHLQNALVINSQHRVQDRARWFYPLKVQPIFPDRSVGEPIPCRGQNLSLTGICFSLPQALPTVDVLILLPATSTTPEVPLPATLIRAERGADGWFEVGAVFRLPESCKLAAGS